MMTNIRTYLIIYCSILLRVRNISDKSCRENKNTHLTFNNLFLNHAVYEMWKKYCRVGQATDENMAHAHYMLDT